MKLIELTPDLSIIPAPGMVIKRADEKCVLFMPGQSAVDGGFLIDDEYENVLDLINEELEGDDG